MDDFKRLGGRYWHDIEPPGDRLTHGCEYTKATYDTRPLWKYSKRGIATAGWHARLENHAMQFAKHGVDYWKAAFAA